MTKSGRFAQLLTPLIALAASTAAAQTTPEPREVYIRDIVANGTGCSLNTTAVNLSADRKSFTILYSDYIAEIFPNSSRLKARRACQVSLDLQVPTGYQFSVATFDYRGFLDLDLGIEAQHESLYYFQGDQQDSKIQEREFGPIRQNFNYRHNIDLASNVWSPCGSTRALNIKNSISLQRSRQASANASGAIGTDSLDGSIKHVVGLRWRRC